MFSTDEYLIQQHLSILCYRKVETAFGVDVRQPDPEPDPTANVDAGHKER